MSMYKISSGFSRQKCENHNFLSKKLNTTGLACKPKAREWHAKPNDANRNYHVMTTLDWLGERKAHVPVSDLETSDESSERCDPERPLAPPRNCCKRLSAGFMPSDANFVPDTPGSSKSRTSSGTANVTFAILE